MKKWTYVIMILVAIAMVASTFKSGPPAHDPSANIVSVAHSYSGGGELCIGDFRATSVMEATITGYSDNWYRIDYIKTSGAAGTAMVYKE